MRCKILLVLFVCVALLNPLISLAQDDAVISGKVTDEAGEPLPGANVSVQLTNLGAATNVKGEYHFTIPASALRGQEVTLEARFIGYRTKSQKLTLTTESHTIDFALHVDVLDMDAIVVTGVVEETPRTKLAFSLGTINREALEKVPTTSMETALRGKIAGVKVVQGSGQPGRDASVILRAATSLNADGRSQDPLYIVDGVIIDPSISGSPLSDINSDDIVNIEVVKGAAGASLYGSRAANGVINITTNRGRGLALNQTRVRIRNEFGFNKLRKDYPSNRHQSHTR
jgi:TonB-dependent SusC/RagA subfamily outer membrane receptor